MKRLALILACLQSFLWMTGCTQGEASPAASPVGTISPGAAQTRIALMRTVEGDNQPTEQVTTSSPTPNATFAPTFAWWNEESEESKVIGNQIVAAIERYYQDTGSYPESLGDLIPHYLDEIPKTTTGHGFAYHLYDNDYYILEFPFTRRNIACGYTPVSKEWECTQFLAYP
jgi:hypothetical protein